MINVASPALASTLVQLGLTSAFIANATRTMTLIKLDPVACPFHRSLEDQLLELIENSELQMRGLLDLDDVIKSASTLTATLHRLAELYVFHKVFDRADRVRDLAYGITRSLAWA